MHSQIHKSIRHIVESNLPGSSVLLFGSQARGDADRFSDYDLLIITPSTLRLTKKLLGARA